MKKVFLFVTVMLLSGFTALCNAQVTSHSSNDANLDGSIDIADVNNVLNEMFGTSTIIKEVVPVESLSSILNPYLVDNSAIVGTWYKSRSENITFNANGTTNYNQGYTYEYRPNLGRILIYDSKGVPTRVLFVEKISSESIILRGGTSPIPYLYSREVPPTKVSSITLSKTSLSMIIGDVYTLEAAVSPSYADNPSVTWSSSNTGVATVNNSGNVTAVAKGNATITCSATDDSGVTATCLVTVGSPADPNILPGKFSVSATKQVQFTKGNLYWDGSTFKFEGNQVESSTGTNYSPWDASHVSHFFWMSLKDYQSSNVAHKPYAEQYNYSSRNVDDEFWCGESNPLTVEGTGGLYALTGGTLNGEWYYLIHNRKNADNLYKYKVTVTNNGTTYTNCLIIAPDDFTGTLQSSYTLDEVNNLGLVCLPAAGSRFKTSLLNGGSYGNYMSSTPYANDAEKAYILTFSSSGVIPADDYSSRSFGRSLRLVRSL